MRRRLLAFALLAGVVACYNRREIARKDWGAIPEDRDIRVQTFDGATRKFDGFVFTPTGVAGWRLRGIDSTRFDSTFVPLDSIAVVRVWRLDRSRTMVLAAAAATTAFIIMAQSQSGVRPEPIPAPSSCPFIYSFDGTEWKFDSETYAGAVARGLERTDVDNLEHLRAVDGRYRLRMKNERHETDYTDEFTLIAVDHPAGTRAVADVAGTVHVVGQGTGPVRVREFGGDTIPSRAGWELSFQRPAGDTVALVLRVRNTGVGPFALYHTLSLLGSDVYGWYATLSAQPLTRAVVKSWVEREGYLDVMTPAASGAWTSRVRLPDVGAAIAKSEVVLLDLSRTAGDAVRVRLESSPQLWLLEGADLAPYLGRATTRALDPMRVVDELGHDVAGLLAKRDGRYLVTTIGSDVSFEYMAPDPPTAGKTRSMLVRTFGHYYVETDDQAAPRRDIVDRLMRDRAFAQQYYSDAWVRAGHEPLVKRSTR
jgi:hypothetical protein